MSLWNSTVRTLETTERREFVDCKEAWAASIPKYIGCETT